jgi:protease-4
MKKIFPNFISLVFNRQPKNDELEFDLNSLADPATQQAFSNAVVLDLLKDRQHERRWKTIKRTLFVSVTLLGVAYYALSYASAAGISMSTSPIKNLGVVRVNGDIMQTSLASSEKIVPALRAAFADPSVKAVVLAIDSPGGSPLEAERINFMISTLRDKYKKPIYASIQNVGASAAYMIAMHTDRIYAGKYSLVGSIGAVMSSWDVHKALDKYDVRQDVYASGELKAMLNPFVEPTPAAKQKAQELVNKAGSMFLAELKQMRGPKLVSDVEYGTGEIWDGEQALKLGLIDEHGTIEMLAEQNEAQIKEFGPGSRTLTPFSFSLADNLADLLAHKVTNALLTNTSHTLK